MSGLEVPVCSLFREKIVSGQVCYEANLNQFRSKVDWGRSLKAGLSFVVDTSEEYQVKNIFRKKESGKVTTSGVFDAYTNSEDDRSFTVMLSTISELLKTVNTNYHHFSRPSPDSSLRRGRLRAHRHQGDQGDGGVPGTGREGDRVWGGGGEV